MKTILLLEPNVLWLITILLWLFTIILSFIKLNRYHEELRRKKAVELLVHWSINLEQKSTLARKYVEKLNKNQTEQLCNQEAIIFDKGSQELCAKIKELLGVDNSNDKSTISECAKSDICESNEKLIPAKCIELRWLVIRYLNMLESILTAWRHRIADTDIIEEQFSYLIHSDTKYEVLKDFRQVTGGRSTYPSIESFCEYLDEKQKKVICRKGSL